ncbi:MAG: DUF4250 domain-containing protein [Firmicutes bacterium]|nr:DUF4250 domain-containing protein [Bacillota bacterium]
MNLPKDKYMLLSYINTQLRDNYADMDELCTALGADRQHITDSLADIGYTYSAEYNSFI